MRHYILGLLDALVLAFIVATVAAPIYTGVAIVFISFDYVAGWILTWLAFWIVLFPVYGFSVFRDIHNVLSKDGDLFVYEGIFTKVSYEGDLGKRIEKYYRHVDRICN